MEASMFDIYTCSFNEDKMKLSVFIDNGYYLIRLNTKDGETYSNIDKELTLSP